MLIRGGGGSWTRQHCKKGKKVRRGGRVDKVLNERKGGADGEAERTVHGCRDSVEKKTENLEFPVG
jgi:hypothetical protein